ncbi:uncharacterized protein Tco025E_04567 [Trypanosoma conorhini]|uniref:Methyltransferase n=1 Tax=Trypanosoma conorhini TaxID=83891 RepID=A0A3R7MNQ8_9TRYP|nr:uncharacterized protein Tco025E_04567 [Trypanosoma conorhini]RNF18218.1 hypothetical protein Tco025E_04567 [Trypanosoma conorhini]
MLALCSANAGLQPADDGPLREVERLFSNSDGLLAALQECLARWGRDAAPPAELLSLLQHARRYTALGGLSGDATATRDMLSATLTLIVRRAVKLEAEGACPCDGAVMSGVEGLQPETPITHEIIDAASATISNCCGGTTRHDADMLFWVRLRGEVVRVVFGFADYAAGETGARLWPGSVALALYLVEKLGVVLHSISATEEGRPLRTIELGCGPALVSLVLASRLSREPAWLRRTWLDVTDISPAVVEEVRRSFTLRNGPELAALFEATEEVGRGAAVRAFCLDFASIPEAMCGQYDLVLGSDIVYDHTIASHVAPALVRLLRAGGMAFLCCERHRDGMFSFVDTIQATMAGSLEVVANHADAQAVLRQLQMIPGLTSTTCSLVVLRRR